MPRPEALPQACLEYMKERAQGWALPATIQDKGLDKASSLAFDVWKRVVVFPVRRRSAVR